MKKSLRHLSTPYVTEEKVYKARRALIKSTLATLGGLWCSRQALATPCDLNPSITNPLKENPNDWSEITRYNNYYEFSTNKEAVIHLAKALTLQPWSIHIEGEVENPQTLSIEQLEKKFTQTQRTYSLRCVEGWSIVIPWGGFPLCELLKIASPTKDANYVEFVSLLRPEEMIGQRRNSFPWPYKEGLRLDEAMHPLTFVALGMYNKPLPKQNGAPIRIVVPWKYGFKSPKAITHIRLVKEQPKTSWNQVAGAEYGFYGNVNPGVPHPRWSQRREIRIGELRKRKTQPFNGYEAQVSHLYKGMDLAKDY